MDVCLQGPALQEGPTRILLELKAVRDSFHRAIVAPDKSALGLDGRGDTPEELIIDPDDHGGLFLRCETDPKANSKLPERCRESITG